MRFELVVGPIPAGATVTGGGRQGGVPLGSEPVVVGRSRAVEVRLRDPRVSRRHLELTATGSCVHVVALDDAAAFVFAGRARRKAELSAGDRFVVGDTVLTIVEAGRPAPGPTVTGARTGRGGIADEARALSAVVDLAAALDTADDPASATAALERWAKSNLGATDLSLSDATPEPDGSTHRVHASLDTADGRVLVVELREAPTVVVQGLVTVCARLAGSRLTVLHERQSEQVDRTALRTAAVGSAREFLGLSKGAEQVARAITKLARSDSTALVTGESGTGKSFAARLIHEASPRSREPLRIINCAAIPEALLESELFGAERGAFSGAVAARSGAFEAVGRGTLVLDEIGELHLNSQAKLLRVLEERRFERVGSNRAIAFEARVIAATNRDLAAMIEQGTFREDLYFRVSVVTLRIAPLRERADDVVMLAQRLLSDLTTTAGRRVDGFSKEALEALKRYRWPGNARELRNVIEHALVMGESRRIEIDDLPERVTTADPRSSTPREPASEEDAITLPARLDWLEARAIESALRSTGGNRTKAAELLGINRVTLQNKLGPAKRSRS